MAENIIITKCVDTGKNTKKGDPVIEIELQDGRKGSAFDTLFLGLPLNKEVSVEVKEAPDYDGKKRYWFMIPNSNTGKKGFIAKDYTFDKRKASLDSAIELGKIHPDKASTDTILQIAEKLFEYLNKK